jgi:transcriptional regulator with XRE-family HTH domain
MANHRQRLGEQIARARKERGWSLADMAKRTGRNAGRFSEMEGGKSNSTVDSLADAGLVLGMELVFVPANRLEEALAMA